VPVGPNALPDAEQVPREMGHAHMSMTQRNVHLSKGHLEEARRESSAFESVSGPFKFARLMWIETSDFKLLEGEMRSRHGSNCLRAYKNGLLLEHQGRRAISQNPVSG
jgi:hypothetical protein